MGLIGVELAPMAQADKLDGVGNGHWLVEALLKGIANKGPRGRMLAASPQV